MSVHTCICAGHHEAGPGSGQLPNTSHLPLEVVRSSHERLPHEGWHMETHNHAHSAALSQLTTHGSQSHNRCSMLGQSANIPEVEPEFTEALSASNEPSGLKEMSVRGSQPRSCARQYAIRCDPEVSRDTPKVVPWQPHQQHNKACLNMHMDLQHTCRHTSTQPRRYTHTWHAHSRKAAQPHKQLQAQLHSRIAALLDSRTTAYTRAHTLAPHPK